MGGRGGQGEESLFRTTFSSNPVFFLLYIFISPLSLNKTSTSMLKLLLLSLLSLTSTSMLSLSSMLSMSSMSSPTSTLAASRSFQVSFESLKVLLKIFSTCELLLLEMS